MPEQYRQSSFIGGARLLSPQVLAQYLDEQRSRGLADAQAHAGAVQQWITALRTNRGAANEVSLEQSFNQRILCGVLGYTLFPAENATAWPKPRSEVTGIAGQPDVLLGEASPAGFRPLAVLELKAPNTPLDLPQARAGRRTAVEQAFEYGEAILGVRWVLVSDMQKIRLYSIESRTEYELFDLSECFNSSGFPTVALHKLVLLLHQDRLLLGAGSSSTSRLLTKSAERQLGIRDAFYEVYYQIRSDLLMAMETALAERSMSSGRMETLECTQRLLDRMLFLYYCEDHPDQLIPRETVRRLTESARALPGANPSRVYASLKALFREVDSGSPSSSGLDLPAYNGELFKPHAVDELELPDALHDKTYEAIDPDGQTRRVQGVWGLHTFDFWQELNEHLLGHIFEESLSDVLHLAAGELPSLAQKLKERKRWGIYYTSQLLSDFLLSSVLRDQFSEQDAISSHDAVSESSLRERLDRLTSVKVVDLACGSGAFLVSAYKELHAEFLRIQAGLEDLRVTAVGSQVGLDELAEARQLSLVLRRCLFGVDLLPQAVEIAKLALWLRSARKGERVADLTENLVSGDSLAIPDTLEKMSAGRGYFDIVVGNPPWGGEVAPDIYENACRSLEIDPTKNWDSWELFILLGLYALRDGGRLALILPDTIFSPEKKRTREILLSQTSIERFHSLGADWFGPNVRMGSILLQARKGRQLILSDISSILLAGHLRRKAIKGEVPLRQIETKLGRLIPQERCRDSDDASIEVFRSREDDVLIAQIEENSSRLSKVCIRARGEEMAKSGLLWRCPSCLNVTTPGVKLKGGAHDEKRCPVCGLTLTPANVTLDHLVLSQFSEPPNTAPFIDGDDIAHRYSPIVPSKRIRLDVHGWPYKDELLYSPPKILIRQAGVGVTAMIDDTDARCPQSVYIYRTARPMASRPSSSWRACRHASWLTTYLSGSGRLTQQEHTRS